MQEISYSDVNLGKESEDMRIALNWININMLCHVEVMFIQFLNLVESYEVYLHLQNFCASSWLVTEMHGQQNAKIIINVHNGVIRTNKLQFFFGLFH